MECPVPETAADKHAAYLASAAEADKKAAQSTDETARKAWSGIADGYRALAANLTLNFKL
jgi:hypothetical protein